MLFPLVRRLTVSHDARVASTCTNHLAKTAHVLTVPRRLKSKERSPKISVPRVSCKQPNQKRSRSNLEVIEITSLQSRHGQSPNADSVAAAMSAFLKANRYEEAHSYFFSQGRSMQNVLVFRTMISLCEQTGKYRESIRFLKLMQKRGLQPDAACLSSGIHAWIKLGDWQQALDLFDEMECLSGISPNIFAYNLALKACVVGGNSRAARSIFKRLCDDPRVRPDIVTLNSVINACAAEGLTDEATGVLMSMSKRHGIEPNSTSFNAAIRACEEEGQWQKARNLIEVMEGSGQKPNVATFTSVIKSCARAGASEEALQTFNTLKEKSILPDEYAVNSILDALGNERFDSEKNLIMQEARKAGLYPMAWRSSSQVDLHRLSVRISCAILRIIFLELESGARNISDILVITGRGNHSDGNAILQQGVLNFNSTYPGPKITKLPGNSGAFSLKAKNIDVWLASRASPQMKK